MTSKKSIVIEEVDSVLVHKDECLLEAFVFVGRYRSKKVNVYIDPQQFLAKSNEYAKNTKIILGRTFDNTKLTGLQIASYLHELGFKRLYLLTAYRLLKCEIPDYLTNVSFDDSEDIIRDIIDE